MQFVLFDAPSSPALPPNLPDGFRYQPDLITPAEEAALIARFAALPFKPFDFRGYQGLRETVSFGWRYDYTARRAEPVEAMPGWLRPLRARAGAFAGVADEELVQALVTRYAPGAPIGWHRDKPHFAEVIGVSFGAAAPLRFRRKAGAGWERRTVVVQPRSGYLLAGAARHEWEHSIPPVEGLRCSVTFRRLA